MTLADKATINAAMRILARYAGYGPIYAIVDRGGKQVDFVAPGLLRGSATSRGLFDVRNAPTPGDAFAELARRLER